jgi:hypothetical protein
MTQKHLDREHQQDLTKPTDSENRITEEAREVMAERRQQEKHQQETMHVRTAAEINSKN